MNIPAVIVVIMLISGVGVQASASHGSDDHGVIYGNTPSIAVNISSNVSYNLTYIGLIYQIPGSSPYVNYFAGDSWNSMLDHNGSISFYSAFYFSSASNKSERAHNSSFSPPSASIFINMTPTNATPSAISSSNASINVTGFSNSTYYKISTYIDISTASSTNTNRQNAKVILVMNFAGLNAREDGYEGNGVMPDHHGPMNFNGYLLNSGKYKALFWWNDSYNLNGANQTMTFYNGNMFGMDSMPESGLNFIFNLSGSQGVIYQDPYLATSGVSITSLTISTVQQQIATFLFQHAELLGTGVAIGAILIALPYVMHRRRRFI